MIGAAIAAACGFAFSPPPAWDRIPLPPPAVIIEAPLDQVDALCRLVPGARRNHVYGCAFVSPSRQVAYVPTWASWQGTRACWLEDLRHETAHLKGWIHQ